MRLVLRNITEHQNTTVELPDRGVVLITGPNGGGKSSLPEAYSLALWGKSLRTTSLWRHGALDAEVVVEDGPLRVTRRRRKDKTVLEFALDGQAETYESTSKAQAVLEALVGQHDVWRRSRVFSTSEMASFSGATDGDRKRLLERVFSLERFDQALKRCRDDLRALRTDVASTNERYRAAVDAAARLTKQIDEISQTLIGLDDPKTPEGLADELSGLQTQKIKAGELIVKLRNDRREIDRQVIELESKLRDAQSHLRALSVDACPSCGQKITAALKKEHEELCERVRQELSSTKPKLAKQIERAQEALKLAESTHDELVQHIAGLNAQIGVAQKQARLKVDLSEKLESWVGELSEIEEHRDALELETIKKSKKLALLEAVESVLDLRGVRAIVIGKALLTIETTTNRWLSRLSTSKTLRVTLSPCSQQASGDTVDKINFGVDGVGHEEGYLGCSNGERRRIDIALLMALAEIASGLSGRTGGVVWFDECFDGLNAEGVDAVCQLLPELAKDRPVAVLSHNEGLIGRLEIVRHLHVEGGQVEVVS